MRSVWELKSHEAFEPSRSYGLFADGGDAFDWMSDIWGDFHKDDEVITREGFFEWSVDPRKIDFDHPLFFWDSVTLTKRDIIGS